MKVRILKTCTKIPDTDRLTSLCAEFKQCSQSSCCKEVILWSSLFIHASLQKESNSKLSVKRCDIRNAPPLPVEVFQGQRRTLANKLRGFYLQQQQVWAAGWNSVSEICIKARLSASAEFVTLNACWTAASSRRFLRALPCWWHSSEPAAAQR